MTIGWMIGLIVWVCMSIAGLAILYFSTREDEDVHQSQTHHSACS